MTLIKESIDSIDELGGILLDVESRVVSANYQELLEDFQPIIADQHASMFSGQFDSSGVPWEPLRPSTIAKKGHDTILFESGALRESLVNVGGPNNINATTERGLIFGTEVEYATFHQTGTPKMPARPPVGMSEETIDELANQVADSTVEKMKYTL